MAEEYSVLIVDRSEETREVLRTALERRGLRILAASRAQRGLELARLHRPDLIVLDLDLEGSDPEGTYARFAQASREHRKPMVTLGSSRRRFAELCETGVSTHSGNAPFGPFRKMSPAPFFVSKPYHYGPLIRRIEEIMGATGRKLARCA